MAAEPAAPGPYEAIHLSGPGRRRGAGGRLPAPALPGAGRLPQGLEDAEDTAAMLEWKGAERCRPDLIHAARRGTPSAGVCPGEPEDRIRQRAISKAAALSRAGALLLHIGPYGVASAHGRRARDPRPRR